MWSRRLCKPNLDPFTRVEAPAGHLWLHHSQSNLVHVQIQHQLKEALISNGVSSQAEMDLVDMRRWCYLL